MEKFWRYKLEHAVFWIITIGFHVYTRLYLIEQAGWWQFALEIILRNSLLAVVIYGNLGYLIPDLALQKKYILYASGLALSLGFYVVTKNFHDSYLTFVISAPVESFWSHSFYNFSIALFYLAFSIALELSKEWFFQRDKLRQLEIEKLNTELEYLKLQINPHFLFNSLNTIYFQIDKSNGVARDTLLMFADLLRYPLYECNGNEVILEKEIIYIRNYFELQRLRKDENFIMKLECDVEEGRRTLAPLLLVPFVENAFKHISHFAHRPNEVRLNIRTNQSVLEMILFNTKDDTGKDTGLKKAAMDGGIGLRNVKRRLDLIYGDGYSLNVREGAHDFEVNLIIPLHEAQLPDR